MAKVIDFDLTGEEEAWERAEDQSGSADIESPKPGVYKAVVEQINPGYSKDDNGKEDKKRPRLEVIYKIVGDAEGDTEALAEAGIEGGNCRGAWLWDYVSFSKASAWKQTQFFKAIGEGSMKKQKGKFNAEKHEGKTEVRVRVKRDTYNDEYSPKIAGTWPWDGPATGSKKKSKDLDDEIEKELGDLPDEDEIKGMKVADLKALAEEHEIDLKGLKKAEAIEKVIEELHGATASEDEEEEEDWDFEEEEEDDEPEYTVEDVRGMGPKELKELAKELDIALKGMKKAEAIEAILEGLGLEDEDDDDVPF